MTSRRVTISFILTLTLILLLGAGCLMCGSVDIPASQVWQVLFGDGASRETWTNIVLELRLPMMVTATVSGVALSIAGLLMQTAFDNPLAGPSIMGVSTGASLGVAIMVIILGASVASTLIGAFAGAAVVIILLVFLSMTVGSSMMLLIAGIMISYLASSAITITNYVATADSLQAYVLWGLGSFGGVDRASLTMYSVLCLVPAAISLLLVKGLDALLLGDRYAANLGVNVVRTRTALLVIAGVLTAVVTAWCGPIAFLGLAVPHITRMLTGIVTHRVLLPMTALVGAMVSLFALWVSLLPFEAGAVPINAITPIIGVPVVIYIILSRRR